MPTVMNGVSLNALTTVDSWSALSLFANGEQGVWYDPSDMSTMFQDAAGTTPAALEQPVGLILDKSKGLTLGSELVTNGDFSNGTTGWSTWSVSGTATLSVSSGIATLTSPAGTAYATAYQAITTVIGRTYKVTGTNISGTSTTFNALRKSDTINGGANTVTIYGGNGVLALGNASGVFVATATTSYILVQTNDAGQSITLDNISVRELPGNHASQSTSTSRPVLSARYNLLTNTELLGTNSGTPGQWSSYRITGTNNIAVAPNGTNTATRLLETTDNDIHSTYLNAGTTVVATEYTGSFSIKGGLGRDWCWVNVYNGSNATDSTAYVFFNLTNGTIGTVGAGATASIINEGNGWYRCVVKRTLAAATSGTSPAGYVTCGPALSNGVASYTGDITKGIYIWGADLRPSNIGVGLPAYQRVGTATYGVTNPSVVGGTPDYDTNGFPPYLKFDGVDDGLSTSSINFTSTDKMSVFTGIRKLSDVNIGQVVELSENVTSFAGSFSMPTSDGGATLNAAANGGNGLPNLAVVTATGFTAPVSTINTSLINFSLLTGDLTFRVNNVQIAASTQNTGSNNFGNYPLYIGSRGGVNYFFNGHLYGLIVRGALSNSTQIENAENYINSKTKAY